MRARSPHIASRLDERAPRATEQVVKAAFEQAGAVMRPQIVAQAHVDATGPVERLRALVNIVDRVKRGCRRAQPFATIRCIGNDNDICFGRDAHKSAAGAPVARCGAIASRNTGHVGSVATGIAVAHLRKWGAARQRSVDLRV